MILLLSALVLCCATQTKSLAKNPTFKQEKKMIQEKNIQAYSFSGFTSPALVSPTNIGVFRVLRLPIADISNAKVKRVDFTALLNNITDNVFYNVTEKTRISITAGVRVDGASFSGAGSSGSVYTERAEIAGNVGCEIDGLYGRGLSGLNPPNEIIFNFAYQGGDMTNLGVPAAKNVQLIVDATIYIEY